MTGTASVWATPPTRVPRPPEPELAPSPEGHDPRERKPWGSRPFYGASGTPLVKGFGMLQFFLDADGHPVRTTRGELVHLLTDDEGQEVLAEEDGLPVVVAVDVPPGAVDGPSR